MYTGEQGVYTYTFELLKKPECPVCGSRELQLEVDGSQTLEEFMDMLADRPDL